MPAEPIRYFHRDKQTVETEQVYGEGWLRWTYETGAGRFALKHLVRRAIVSRYYGWRMGMLASANQILPFIVKYDLDVDELAKSPLRMKSFNEFFSRGLKPGARLIAGNSTDSTGSPQADSGQGDRVAVLPADGRHLAFQNVDAAAGFYVKGQKFDLKAFLGDEALAAKFAGGSMLISRLCPVDYHRFHFPVAGMPSEPRLINGWLYSVSPIALRRDLAYLWENKRMVTLVDSPVFGQVAVCEIGATMVGTIVQTFLSSRAVKKGEEKGLFKFGGSCVVTLFQPGKIKIDADLVQHSSEGLEVYARMGEQLGAAS